MHCHYFFLSEFSLIFLHKVASVLNQNIKNSLIRIYASYIELELKTLYIYLYKHSVVYVLFLTVFES